jgi:hypothetical protein
MFCIKIELTLNYVACHHNSAFVIQPEIIVVVHLQIKFKFEKLNSIIVYYEKEDYTPHEYEQRISKRMMMIGKQVLHIIERYWSA